MKKKKKKIENSALDTLFYGHEVLEKNSENILLSADSTVKLADFGLACIVLGPLYRGRPPLIGGLRGLVDFPSVLKGPEFNPLSVFVGFLLKFAALRPMWRPKFSPNKVKISNFSILKFPKHI